MIKTLINEIRKYNQNNTIKKNVKLLKLLKHKQFKCVKLEKNTKAC